jgi:hypothetical protein
MIAVTATITRVASVMRQLCRSPVEFPRYETLGCELSPSHSQIGRGKGMRIASADNSASLQCICRL